MFDMTLLAKAFPLVMAGKGEWVKIVGVTGGENWTRSLHAMGLVPETEVQVCHCDKGVGVVVSHEGRQIALGKALIHRIMVSVISRAITDN